MLFAVAKEPTEGGGIGKRIEENRTHPHVLYTGSYDFHGHLQGACLAIQPI